MKTFARFLFAFAAVVALISTLLCIYFVVSGAGDTFLGMMWTVISFCAMMLFASQINDN